MDRIAMALVATLGTWFITALGAATVMFFKGTNQKAMNLMLGFAAGVMIAASFWSLLQPAIERADAYLKTPSWIVCTAGFLLGALFMWASDKIVTYCRGKERAELPNTEAHHNNPAQHPGGACRWRGVRSAGHWGKRRITYGSYNHSGRNRLAEFPGGCGGVASFKARRAFPREELSYRSGFGNG